MDPPLTSDAMRQRFRDFDTVHDDASDYFGGAFGGFDGLDDFDSVIIGGPGDSGSIRSEPILHPSLNLPSFIREDDDDDDYDIVNNKKSSSPHIREDNDDSDNDNTRGRRQSRHTGDSRRGKRFLAKQEGRIGSSFEDSGVVGYVPDPVKQAIAAEAAARAASTATDVDPARFNARTGAHSQRSSPMLGTTRPPADVVSPVASSPALSPQSTNRRKSLSHAKKGSSYSPDAQMQNGLHNHNTSAFAYGHSEHGSSHARERTFMSTSSTTTIAPPSSPPAPTFTTPPARAIPFKRTSLPTQTTLDPESRLHEREQSSVSVDHHLRALYAPSSATALSAPASVPVESSATDINWKMARDAYIMNPNGDRVRFEMLCVGLAKNSVLVFVTQKDIEISALVYGRVAHLLHQAGARIIFVTPWSPKQATAFLNRFERINPFPGSLLCDPDASLYGAFGLKRGALASMLPSVHMPMRHGVRNAVGIASYRHANRDLASTHTRASRIKTGVVVLETSRHAGKLPNVLLLEEESAETGPGCYLDVLPVCGVNGAFVPELDISHVIHRFQTMRQNQEKARSEAEKLERGSQSSETQAKR